MSLLEGSFVVLSPVGSYHAIVAATGEIDTATSLALGQVLDEVLRDRPKTLTVDMSDGSFIDTCGLAVLVDAVTRTQTIGTTFRLWGASPIVVQLLEITKLHNLIPLLPRTDPLGHHSTGQ